MKYKGILLDIDNTLYDYTKTHAKALDVLMVTASQKLNINVADLEHAYRDARKQINSDLYGTASCHNRLLYIQKMLEFLNKNALATSLELYEIYWNSFLDNMEVYEGVYDFLDGLQGTDVCLLTDLTAHIQHRKIKKLGLDKYANYVVTSEEAGKEKPHPYMFLLALQKMHLKPNEVCMIGDSFKKDILGASQLEIASYWLNNTNQIEDVKHKNIMEFSQFDDLSKYILQH